MLSFLTTAITTLQAASATSAELIRTQGTQEQYAQDIKAIRTDIGALRRAVIIAIKSGPTSAGPQLYAHVAATIPLMPQAIRQATHKPTTIHKIIIRIGDAADRQEALKQNS